MKKILFVCIENSCRSQIAEAFARMYGSDLVEAYSSGSRPSGIVNERAIALMAEIGYDLSQHRSKPLDGFGSISFDYVITMGCGDECPFIAAKHREDWTIADPRHMSDEEFRNVLDILSTKVRQLLTRLG